MEPDGVGDVEVDVNILSDDELSCRLRQLGANIGPITGMLSRLTILGFCCRVCIPAMRILSVSPSLKSVICDKTKEWCVQIFILYKRPLSLVFREEEWLVEATAST